MIENSLCIQTNPWLNTQVSLIYWTPKRVHNILVRELRGLFTEQVLSHLYRKLGGEFIVYFKGQ